MFIKINPQEALHIIKNKVKPQWKLAFCATLVIGILTHTMIFINDIPNHDGLASMYFDQNMITSGRWFLTIATGISSYFTLPWLIGLLSLLFLGLTAVVLIELLEIKCSVTIVAISGLLVTFPALASTFSYLFTADGYMLALFLATIAVYLTKRYKSGFIIGGICLAFSLGIYQAYLSFAMLLCLYQVFVIALLDEKKIEKIKKIVRFIYMGVIGGSLYYGILQLLLWIQGVELSSYQGINGIDTSGMVTTVANTENVWIKVYHDFLGFFFKGNVIFNNSFSAVSMILIVVSVIVVLLMLVTKKKLWKSPYFYIMGLGGIVVIPIITNSILIISPEVYYHLIMKYHYILFAILGIAFVERYGHYTKGYLVQWVVILSAFVMIMNYMVMDNIAYSNMDKKFDKTYAYCLRLVDRMEQTEGYYQGIPIAMVGVVNTEEYPMTDISLGITGAISGTHGDLLVYTGKNYKGFMEHYLNVTIENVSAEEMNRIYDTPEYQALETFPATNSMKVVDGILYIKTE